MRSSLLRQKGIVRTLYDPTCGTGGMLSVAEEYLRQLNPAARLQVFGQELNEETYAICESDMMIKGYDPSNVKCGNSFTRDGFAGQRFDYFLANPPYGVEWKKVETFIRNKHEKMGYGGRFGAGLPRINDGSFLVLQHMISKWKPAQEGGSRLAIVLNGSPLFAGGPGSGESEIRRWIVENGPADSDTLRGRPQSYSQIRPVLIWQYCTMDVEIGKVRLAMFKKALLAGVMELGQVESGTAGAATDTLAHHQAHDTRFMKQRQSVV